MMTTGIAQTSRWLRLLPTGTPGKHQLARRLLHGRLPAGETRVTDRLGLSYRVADLHDPIAFDLLVNGVHEPDVLAVILDLVPDRGTYLDVGANVGAFALPAACKVGQFGSVVAIEEALPLFQCLRANAAVNGLANVTTIHTTLADLDRTSLDQFLIEANVRHVDLLRLDSSVHVASVLESASTLLSRPDSPAIVFSSGCGGDVQQSLIDRGYTLWRVGDYRRRRAPLTAPLSLGNTVLIAKRV
jgi:hypothetical protein